MYRKKTEKLKPMTSRTNKIPLLPIAILSLTAAASIGVNIFFFEISHYTLLVYSLGAFTYFIYVKLCRFQHTTSIDYIPSGEAAIETFIIFFAIKFITSNIYLSFFIATAAVTIIEFFATTAINFKHRERLFLGFMINVITIIFFLFFAMYDRTFSLDELEPIVLGYCHSEPENMYSIAVPIVIFIAFYFFSNKLSHEISLFSFGKSYRETSGFNYRIFEAVMTPFKGLIITLTFFSIGWFGGIGNYIRTDHSKGILVSDTTLLLILITYIQIILSLSVYVDYTYIIAINTALSYVLFIYRAKKDKGL